MVTICSVDACPTRVESHGYCVKHWRRVQAHGAPDVLVRPWDADLRFERDHVVNAVTGCWHWAGKDRNQFGHARWFVGGKHLCVHRWAYERFVGPIPEGLVIDHLCRNPGCVNPAHLEPVTQPENVMRAETAITTINAKKTHCKWGHEFSIENTAMSHNNGRPSRQCRHCRSRRSKEAAMRKAAL